MIQFCLYEPVNIYKTTDLYELPDPDNQISEIFEAIAFRRICPEPGLK